VMTTACIDPDIGFTLPLLGESNQWPKVKGSDREPYTHGTFPVLHQFISHARAFLILPADLANHKGWLAPGDRRYNLMNLVGGLLLFWIAVADRRAGFMVLELTWAFIALPPLLRSRVERPQT